MRLWLRSLTLLFVVLAGTAHAADSYQLGKQYVMVNEQSPPQDPKKISVEEFFWYGCPHCYKLEPYLNAWIKKKPAYVDMRHVPNSLGRPIGELHERAFYIADILGIEDKIRQPMFDGLREVEQGNKALTTLDDIKALYVKVGGIKPGDFDGLVHSFAVDNNISRADKLSISYRVTSTPTIVVDGRWMTDVAKAGGDEELIKLLDYLVAKAKDERGIK